MRFLFIILIIFPSASWSQLPRPNILAEHKVKSVEMWKHGMDPLVEGKLNRLTKKEVRRYKKEANRKQHISTWFIGNNGLPDSCWVFDDLKKNKTAYKYGYDDQLRVVFLEEDKNDVLVSRQKVVTLENGNLNMFRWDKKTEDWAFSYALRSDSLFLLWGTVSDSTAYQYDDRETGVIARAKYKEGKLAHRYSERWTIKPDGTPDSLIITFVQFEDKNGRDWFPESSVTGFKLREDGSVIPENGNNNYWNRNYYKRGHKTTPFDEKKPYNDPRNFMNSNQLVEKSDVFIQRTFMSIHPQYYLGFRFTYKK